MQLIAEDGPLRGIVLNLEEGTEWTIGRDPDLSDLILEDSTVSRQHLRLYATPEGIYVENISQTNPVELNGVTVTTPQLLQKNALIKIGNNIFSFHPEAPEVLKKEKKRGRKKTSLIHEEAPLESPAKLPLSQQKEKPLVEEATPFEESLIPPMEKIEEEPPSTETIFEEGVEEVVPFQIPPEKTLFLKVISGPNAGAEFGMEKGRAYLIGKEPSSCDIVFNDLSVSRQHAQLSIDEEGKIEIEDLESKNGTLINGVMEREKRTLTIQDLVSLGTTTFVVYNLEGASETIYSPIPKLHEQAVTEKKVEVPLPKDWKKTVIPPKYLLLGALSLVILLIAFVGFFSLLTSEKIEKIIPEPTEEIQKVTQKYNDVRFSFNPNIGKLFLVGHILTDVDKQELLFSIHLLPFVESIEDNLIIDEYVWKNMNDVLTENPTWRGISIHAPTAGKFIATGYLSSLDQAQKLSEYLNVTFPYLDRLENHVAVESVIKEQVAQLLFAQGIGTVSFQLTNGELILSGLYGSDRSKEFLMLLHEFKAIRGIRSVKNLAIVTSPENARIDLTTQYNVSGAATQKGKNFSLLINGQIISAGELLDGMKITSIESRVILLEKDGLKYKINYNR